MRLRRHGAPGERVVVRRRTLTALESEERERRETREERAAAGAGEGREGEESRKRERKADKWAPHHVASTYAKLPTKTVRWPNMNDFESWVAADVWF